MVEALVVPPEIDVKPTDEAILFIENSERVLTSEDPTLRELRAELKGEVTSLSNELLERFGVQSPVEVDSVFDPEVKIDSFFTQTPMVQVRRRDGLLRGVVLSDEPYMYIAPPDPESGSSFPTEERGVKAFHIDLYDWETGEKIGRKSAGFYGARFAKNAGGDQASPLELQGMVDILTHMKISLEMTQLSNGSMNGDRG